MKFTCALLFALIASALALTREQIEKNPSRGEENRRHPEYTEGDIIPDTREKREALEEDDEEASRFEENPGESLLEGDIIAPTGEERFTRNALVYQSMRWPRNTLRYYLSPSLKSDVKKNVGKAIARLRVLFKNCLRFSQSRTPGKTAITVQNGSGCSASMGYNSGSKLMRLSSFCPAGTIMHEFLHSLGVHHTQTRADRDSYVRINWGNIKKGVESNFKKTNNAYDTMGFGYDYGSIMHYGPKSFAVNRKQNTITQLKKGPKIGQRTDLSSGDIALVKKMYKC